MRELRFSDPDDFEKLFSDDNKTITDYMLEGISEAFKYQKRTAKLFRISFDLDDNYSFEITLPRSQWVNALKKCMKNYEKWELTDEILDTYLVMKEIKKWDTEQG